MNQFEDDLVDKKNKGIRHAATHWHAKENEFDEDDYLRHRSGLTRKTEREADGDSSDDDGIPNNAGGGGGVQN